LILSGIVGKRYDKSLFGKKLGGDFSAGIHDCGVDEESFLDAIQEGIAEGRLALLAAEGSVRVEEKAPFSFAGIAPVRGGPVKSTEVVAGIMSPRNRTAFEG
jgi:hypothetical protein